MKGMIYLFNSQKNAEPGDVVIVSDPMRFFENISRRRDVDPNGYLDVVAHGSPDAIKIKLKDGRQILINWRVLSKMIKNQPNNRYKGIRLLSCKTGSSGDCFAQNLANKMNMVVIAPSNLLWAYSNGTHVVAPRMSQDPSNPHYNEPDLTNEGKFNRFYPGGNKKWKK